MTWPSKCACPRCSSSRVRDMRRVPVLMGIWFGFLASIAVLPLVRRVIPDAHIWLILSSCLPAATLAGCIFCRVARRHAAQYECRHCHNRWRDTAQRAALRTRLWWQSTGRVAGLGSLAASR